MFPYWTDSCRPAYLQTLTTTNPQPYCAELYNARELPYGFFSFDLPQLFGEGFPVFFDINLSADEVQNFYQYVEEGLYYDSNTRCACQLISATHVKSAKSVQKRHLATIADHRPAHLHL